MADKSKGKRPLRRAKIYPSTVTLYDASNDASETDTLIRMVAKIQGLPTIQIMVHNVVRRLDEDFRSLSRKSCLPYYKGSAGRPHGTRSSDEPTKRYDRDSVDNSPTVVGTEKRRYHG